MSQNIEPFYYLSTMEYKWMKIEEPRLARAKKEKSLMIKMRPKCSKISSPISMLTQYLCFFWLEWNKSFDPLECSENSVVTSSQ